MERYRSLVHWRGLSAVGVLFFHVYEPLQEKIGWSFLAGTAGYGWLGVSLFFVVSGYCVSERLAREFESGGAVAGFFLDRCWRLLPPYWAALGLMLALRLAALPFNGGQGSPDWTVWWTAPFLMEKLAGHDHVLLVAWSLAYEFTFYVVAGVGLVVVQLVRRQVAVFAYLTVVTALVWLPAWPGLHGLASGWTQFTLGVAVWIALRRGTVSVRAVSAAVLGVLAAFLHVRGGALQLATAAGFAALLLLLAPCDRSLAESRLLRPLAWVGTMSYSLYLTHVPIISPLRNLVGRGMPSSPVALFLLGLTCAGVAIAFAWQFYRQVERRVEDARRRHLHSGRMST